MKRMARSIILALAAAGAARAAGAPASRPAAVRLEVSPAGQPDPALKYTLITPTWQRVDGDAAAFYLSATGTVPETVKLKDGSEADLSDLLDKYMGMSLEELKASDARQHAYRNLAHHELELGATRSRAEWPNAWREEGAAALLPYLNGLRTTARCMVVYARLQLADGDVAGAIGTYRSVMMLAYHLRENGMLVPDLVGCGIAELALEHLPEVMQRADGPNLYWALAGVPRPMFDAGEALGYERMMVRASIGPLRGGRRPEELSAGDWGQVAADLTTMFTQRGGASDPRPQLAATAVAIPFYPRAKQYLIEHGTPANVAEAMPVPEVVGRVMFETYDHFTDEMAKWASVPYWQAAGGLERTRRAIEAAKAAEPLNPAFSILVTPPRAFWTFARLDRRVAALQTVEAIRAYAAGHGGAPPASLDQITETPAPIDPTTGRVFEYKVTSDTTAEVSSPGAGGAADSSLRYVITLRK